MNLEQTQIVGLTMELDLKVREYKELCEKLEELKSQNVDVKDKRLTVLLDMFEENHNAISEINKKLRILNKS